MLAKGMSRIGHDYLQTGFYTKYFSSLGMKKLPSIQSLKQEYAALLSENRKTYPELKQARAKMIELMTARNNVEHILGMSCGGLGRQPSNKQRVPIPCRDTGLRQHEPDGGVKHAVFLFKPRRPVVPGCNLPDGGHADSHAFPF